MTEKESSPPGRQAARVSAEYQERNILSTKVIRLEEDVVIISGTAILRRRLAEPGSSLPETFKKLVILFTLGKFALRDKKNLYQKTVQVLSVKKVYFLQTFFGFYYVKSHFLTFG